MKSSGRFFSGKRLGWSVLAALLVMPFFAQNASAGGSIQRVANGHFWWIDRFVLGDATHDVGAIEARFEIVFNGKTTNKFQVLTTIISVNPGTGWSANIKKDGGLNNPIEVEFTSVDGCQQKFRWLVIPGRTKGDFGQLKCKKK